ncbi:TIM barrel protein [Megalodesulfovibrio paquesii]
MNTATCPPPAELDPDSGPAIDDGNVFASNVCFAASTLDELVHQARQAGVSGLELSAGLACPVAGDGPAAVAGLAATLARHVAESGFRFRIHNYFPPPANQFVLNLASNDPDVLKASLTLCRTALQLCAALEIPYYSVHAGFCVHASPADLGRPLRSLPRIPAAQAQEIFVQSVQILAREAAELGLELAVENNVVEDSNFLPGDPLLLGGEPLELLMLLERIAAPNVGLLLDLGHLHVSARTLGFEVDSAVRLLAPHVRVVHVSHNDGLADRHLPLPPDGGLFRRLAPLLPGGVDLVLEAWRVPFQDLRPQLDLLEAVFRSGRIPPDNREQIA